MRVVHVIGALVAGGAERFVSALVQELKKSCTDVNLVVLSNRTDAVGDNMLLELEEANVKCYVGPTQKVGVRTVFWYIRKLFEEKPEVVHLHTPNTELTHYIATWLYKEPHRIYRTLHSVKLPRSLVLKLAMHANKLLGSIACGSAVYEVFHSHLGAQIVAIENGVRFNWPIRTDEIALKAKVQFGFESRKVHFLSAGRLAGKSLQSSPKGYDVLIDAWRNGGLGDKGCVLHILGDGELREDLEFMAAGDSSIIFHGVQARPWEWLLAADCFVMPSRYEGLPLAGIEAIGTGLPCVFSDIASLRAIDAPEVRWVPVGDSCALMQSLLQVLNSRPVIDRLEILKFRKRFDITNTAQKYRNIYEDHRVFKCI